MPLFSPVSAGGIGKATVNATTGSPTTNNIARAGKTIYEFNGSGSITVGTAGTAEILVVAGGGGGSGYRGGGGGAGGVLSDTSAYLPSGVLTVTVGSGGAAGAFADNVGLSAGGNNGQASFIGNYFAIGGGGGSQNASGSPNTGGGGGGGNGTTAGFRGGGNGGSGIVIILY